MARRRSDANTAVPLSTPRRKTSPPPASRRMVSPRRRMRDAISSALKTGRSVSLINPHFAEHSAGPAHFETFGDFHAPDPHDLAVPDQKRDSVANAGVDFTINEKVFELFRLGHAQGLEAIAGTAVADGEVRTRALR